MKKIELPFYESTHGSALTPEEEIKMVAYCRVHPEYEASSALLCLLYFGLRQSELPSMRIIDDRWIEVDTSKQKLGRDVVPRKIPKTPMVQKVLPIIDFNKARIVKQRTIASALKRILPNHHPHELRSTYITRCKQCKVDPEIVMLWDGHEEDKDVRTSKVDRGYTDFSLDFQWQEAQKVNY